MLRHRTNRLPMATGTLPDHHHLGDHESSTQTMGRGKGPFGRSSMLRRDRGLPRSGRTNENSPSATPARELIRVLIRHKKKALTLALLIVSLTVAVVLFYPRTYDSQGRLFVRVGRESIALDPTAKQGKTFDVKKNYAREINSIREILKSRVVAERTVALVGVERILGMSDEPVSQFKQVLGRAKDLFHQIDPISDQERAIDSVQQSTKIRAAKDSDVLVVSCRAKSPRIAHAMVESLLDAFLEEHIRVSRTHGAFQFFTEQAAQQKERLDKASRKFCDFKNRDGVASIGGPRSLLMNQIEQIDAEEIQLGIALAYSEGRLRDLQKTVDALTKMIISQVTDGFGNDATESMRQQLYQLALKKGQQPHWHVDQNIFSTNISSFSERCFDFAYIGFDL